MGGGLEAGAQRNEEVVGDVAFGEPHLLRSRAIYGVLQPGLIERLLNMDVNCTGHGTNFVGYPGGDGEIVREVRSGNLNIDRRGQTEIENLADDIRRFEEECGSR